MKKDRRTRALLLMLLLRFGTGRSDYAPYFYDNGPSSDNGNMNLFSISEDTPVGSLVYVLNGTDPEDDPVRYGLSFDQGSREYFRAEPQSGNVTLVQELDRELQDEISVSVSITDGRNKVVETARIFVTDANDEAPEFQNLPFIIRVSEDAAPGTSVYKVEAVDRDMGSGGSVSYSLLASSSGPFTIDPHSGILRVRPGETLDYETTPTHFITVIAKDGGGKFKGRHQVLSSKATVTVNLEDAQDMAPAFVGTPYFGYVYEVSVPGSEVFTVSARDGDQGNPNPMHYQLISGAEGVFDINSTSGCITLNTPPSSLRNELYEIVVKAWEQAPDGSLLAWDQTTVTVRVVDLNNHPPTFYGESGPQNRFELTLSEHPPAGEILRGFKITVNDSDQGANAKFKLRLVGPSHILRVVPQTVLNEAQVTIIVEDTSGIDYERGPTLSFKLLAVEVDTPERFSSTADILIHLLDTNDNIPQFTAEYYIARVPENSAGGCSVVSVQAVDPDSGPWGDVSYTIYGSGADLFSIHSSSGLISTQPWTSLDAEVRSKYNFYVKAEDSEGKYSLAEVFVTVADMNDHPPEFQEKQLEKTMIIGSPVKVEAVDEDAESPNNLIEYSIMRADPDNAFDINAETGEIYLKPHIKTMEIVQNITRQKDCTWSLVVQAKDLGSPSFSATALVNIDITEAIKGRVITYFRGLRKRPLTVFGIFFSLVMSFILLTVCISTILYCNSVKKSRIRPENSYIKDHLKGPMAAFLLRSRDNPMKAIAMLIGIVSVFLGVTAMLSTALFLRNSKSNRISPVRRIIKRRQEKTRQTSAWRLQMPLFSRPNPGIKFLIEDTDANRDQEAGRSSPRSRPEPPSAPLPPPPPCLSRASERPRPVPTVSGALASKAFNKASRRKEGNMSSALVSELKQKLEQKIIESNKGYYC